MKTRLLLISLLFPLGLAQAASVLYDFEGQTLAATTTGSGVSASAAAVQFAPGRTDDPSPAPADAFTRVLTTGT